MFTLTLVVSNLTAYLFQAPVGTPTPAADPTTVTSATPAGGEGAILPWNLILPALVVTAGIILLIILILLAARIFGRRSGKQPRALRGQRPAAAGGAPARPVETAALPVESRPRAHRSVQPSSRWLVRPDGQKVMLAKLPLTIGRDKSNQIVIDDATLADVHARIFLEEKENVLCIEDATDGNSAVLVNGSPTRKNVLSDSDRISLGDVTLQYHEAAPGQG